MILPVVIIILTLIADQLAKKWALSYLTANGPTHVNALFTFRETYNRGIAFGMFQGIGPLVGWLTVFVVLGMLIFLWRMPRNQRVGRVGLALIIGGALGNLLDRITAGRVLDFIETPLRPGIFNLADLAINLGTILILIAMIRSWVGSRSTLKEEGPPL